MAAPYSAELEGVTEKQMQNCVRFAAISPQRSCGIVLLSSKCFDAVKNVVSNLRKSPPVEARFGLNVGGL